MTAEIEYHLRAMIFAAACTLATFWFRRESPNGNWGDAFGQFCVYWVAGLSLLWWRVPNGRFQRLIDAISHLHRRHHDDTDPPPK